MTSFILFMLYNYVIPKKGGDYMESPKRRKKSTKRPFKSLHNLLIVSKYFLKIGKVLKELIDLFR